MMNSLKQSATTAICFALILGYAATGIAQEQQSTQAPGGAKAKQTYALGVQAYIWGYPMVVMQKSRDAMTKGGDAPVTPNQFNKSGLLFAPVNQVANAWSMLGPNFSAVQSANSDTQYSVTWFDVSDAPYVLQIPHAKRRYYTYQFIDAWTNNFHYASTRTMGSVTDYFVRVSSSEKVYVPRFHRSAAMIQYTNMEAQIPYSRGAAGFASSASVG
jgi:hypothetical protein